MSANATGSASARPPIPRRADFPADAAGDDAYNEAAWAEALTHRFLVLPRVKYFQHHRAWGYIAQREPLEALVNEGLSGVRHAIDKWEPHRGAFSTRARWWIDNHVRRCLLLNLRLIHLPISDVAMVISLRNGNKVKPRSPYQAECVARMAPLLDAKFYSQDSSHARGVIDKHSDECTLARNSDQAELMAKVMAAIELLPERERSILLMRFPLDGSPPKTLKETAEVTAVCRERIRQIEQQALAKIRSFVA